MYNIFTMKNYPIVLHINLLVGTSVLGGTTKVIKKVLCIIYLRSTYIIMYQTNDT